MQEPDQARLKRPPRTDLKDSVASPTATARPAIDDLAGTIEMVPVRGYDKGCSLENVEFVGIAA